MITETIGANIRKNRLKLGWTQEKLADTLCISHQIVSRWENGLAAPDITTLWALTGIFRISLDELCGRGEETVRGIIESIEQARSEPGATYEDLFGKWREVEGQLFRYPTNEELLFAALQLLRSAHDRVMTDGQKEEVNGQILKIAERLLDFSTNDAYRSYANYNLALYFDEQVNLLRRNEEDLKNAKKAREFADLVCYKDMQKTLYHSFGVTSASERTEALEKTLFEMVDGARGACKNLLHGYQITQPAFEMPVSNTAMDTLKEIEEKLGQLLSLCQSLQQQRT